MRSAKRLTVGTNCKRLTLLSAKLVKGFVIRGERDGTSKSLLDGSEVSLLGVDSQAVPDNLKRILRHVGEDIEKALTIESKVSIERVRGCWDGERVALEEHVEHANANGPDVGLRSRVASIARIVLLRSHVAVAAHSDLPRPSVESSQTEVTELHRAILSKENVLRLDVAMVDAFGVDVLHSTDQLHHEVADVLRLQRTLVKADGLVQVTVGAVLEDKVDVVLGLKGLEKVDDVGMGTKPEVDTELLRALVDSKCRRAIDGSRGLGNNLDGNEIIGHKVLGLEDHAKGAIVECRNGFVSAMEYNTCLKLITHALHEEGWDELQVAKQEKLVESTRS